MCACASRAPAVNSSVLLQPLECAPSAHVRKSHMRAQACTCGPEPLHIHKNQAINYPGILLPRKYTATGAQRTHLYAQTWLLHKKNRSVPSRGNILISCTYVEEPRSYRVFVDPSFRRDTRNKPVTKTKISQPTAYECTEKLHPRALVDLKFC